jgi:hypothetical protein
MKFHHLMEEFHGSDLEVAKFATERRGRLPRKLAGPTFDLGLASMPS